MTSDWRVINRSVAGRWSRARLTALDGRTVTDRAYVKAPRQPIGDEWVGFFGSPAAIEPGEYVLVTGLGKWRVRLTRDAMAQYLNVGRGFFSCIASSHEPPPS